MFKIKTKRSPFGTVTLSEFCDVVVPMTVNLALLVLAVNSFIVFTWKIRVPRKLWRIVRCIPMNIWYYGFCQSASAPVL